MTTLRTTGGRGTLPRLDAPPVTTTYSAPAALAASPFSTLPSRPRSGRQSEAIKAWLLCAADRGSTGPVGRLAAISGDVSHQQFDELAFVVRDGSKKRALVASIVGDPAQIEPHVLWADRQAARRLDEVTCGRACRRSARRRCRGDRYRPSPRLRRSHLPARFQPGMKEPLPECRMSQRAPMQPDPRQDKDARSVRERYNRVRAPRPSKS